MNKDFFKTPTTIAAAFVCIGFLLPWVLLVPFGSISGYDIPKAAEMFAGLKGMIAGDESSSATELSQFYYLLYLIPLLSLYLIYGEYKDSQKFFIPAKVVIFLLSVFVVYKIKSLGNTPSVFEIGIGLWITLAGSVYLLILAIKDVLSPKPIAPNQNQTKDVEQTQDQ